MQGFNRDNHEGVVGLVRDQGIGVLEELTPRATQVLGILGHSRLTDLGPHRFNRDYSTKFS